MAYLGNLLSAGHCAVAIPAGLELTLRYNTKGHIERIFEGFGDDGKDLTSELLTTFLKNKTVPNTILANGSTCYVYGVLYTTEEYSERGTYPECIFAKLTERYLKIPTRFRFLAGSAESDPTRFTGYLSIHQWLTMNGFTALPGFVIPSNMTQDTHNHMLVSARADYDISTITGYFTFNQADVNHVRLALRQFMIMHTEVFNEPDGEIKVNLRSAYNRDLLTVPLSTYMHNDLRPGTVIVFNDKRDIVHLFDEPVHKNGAALGDQVKCSVCHRVFTCPKSGPVYCTDPNCNSNLYPRVRHFLKALGLDNMDVFTYKKMTEKVGNIFTVVDTLDYLKCEAGSIQVTLPVLLFAVTPIEVVATQYLFEQMYHACNKSRESVEYYLSNPDKMKEDFKFESVYLDGFIKWISKNENFMTVKGLLDHEAIKLVETSKAFDGAPIFRGKTIMITGKFKHGSSSDIIEIIGSYSARVTTQLVPDADCVVIGGLNEDINGAMVSSCKNNGVPIYSEDYFFSEYGIDTDLAENLT